MNQESGCTKLFRVSYLLLWITIWKDLYHLPHNIQILRSLHTHYFLSDTFWKQDSPRSKQIVEKFLVGKEQNFLTSDRFLCHSLSAWYFSPLLTSDLLKVPTGKLPPKMKMSSKFHLRTDGAVLDQSNCRLKPKIKVWLLNIIPWHPWKGSPVCSRQ